MVPRSVLTAHLRLTPHSNTHILSILINYNIHHTRAPNLLLQTTAKYTYIYYNTILYYIDPLCGGVN